MNRTFASHLNQMIFESAVFDGIEDLIVFLRINRSLKYKREREFD